MRCAVVFLLVVAAMSPRAAGQLGWLFRVFSPSNVLDVHPAVVGQQGFSPINNEQGFVNTAGGARPSDSRNKVNDYPNRTDIQCTV